MVDDGGDGVVDGGVDLDGGDGDLSSDDLGGNDGGGDGVMVGHGWSVGWSLLGLG